ncbi:MAG: OmpH family outer membrane protein [Bacteroidales bacterium]
MEKKVNTLIGINVLIIIAVIVLFVLQFSGGDQAEKQPTGTEKDLKTGQNLKVGYVNTDSVLNKYKLVEIMEAKLEGEAEAMQKELQRKQQQLEQKYQQYQQGVKNNSINVEEANRIEQELKKEEEELYQIQQEYSQQYADQTRGMNKKLVDTLRNFLDRYNRSSRFDYILAKSSTNNNILYSNESLDITPKIIKKLNEEYEKKK